MVLRRLRPRLREIGSKCIRTQTVTDRPAFTQDSTDPNPFGSVVRTQTGLLSKVIPFDFLFDLIYIYLYRVIHSVTRKTLIYNVPCGKNLIFSKFLRGCKVRYSEICVRITERPRNVFRSFCKH